MGLHGCVQGRCGRWQARPGIPACSCPNSVPSLPFAPLVFVPPSIRMSSPEVNATLLGGSPEDVTVSLVLLQDEEGKESSLEGWVEGPGAPPASVHCLLGKERQRQSDGRRGRMRRGWLVHYRPHP